MTLIRAVIYRAVGITLKIPPHARDTTQTAQVVLVVRGGVRAVMFRKVIVLPPPKHFKWRKHCLTGLNAEHAHATQTQAIMLSRVCVRRVFIVSKTPPAVGR